MLSRAAQSLGFDLILCGRQAIDDDMAQIGPALAVYLQIPCVTVVTQLDFSKDWKMAIATRQIEGGSEVIDFPLPSLLTCQKGLNQPRLPSLKGIMASKKREIEVMDANKLAFVENERKVPTNTLVQTGLSLPDRPAKGKIIDKAPNEAVAQLVKILREQEKVV